MRGNAVGAILFVFFYFLGGGEGGTRAVCDLRSVVRTGWAWVGLCVGLDGNLQRAAVNQFR